MRRPSQSVRVVFSAGQVTPVTRQLADPTPAVDDSMEGDSSALLAARAWVSAFSSVLTAPSMKPVAAQLNDLLLTAESTEPPITETHPDCDLLSAYAIASAVNDLKIASGQVIKGHKIGLTSQVTRDLAGGEGPDFGTLFDDMFIAEESSVSRSRPYRFSGISSRLGASCRPSANASIRP